MTKTAREILRHHLKRVYFNGSTDTIARQNGVIPNDTKLGETQIEVELDQALKELEAIISERPIHHHPEHMAYMHTRELDWLKSLQMHDGVLMYNTGVILQPVSDRIQMYEDMFTRRPDTYKKVTSLYGKETN